MTDFYKEALSNDSELVTRNKGGNIIPPAVDVPLWKQYLEKFNDPIVIVLLVVFVLSVGVSFFEFIFKGAEWTTFIEPLGVFIALVLSTGIAFVCEVRANNEFKVLNQVKDQRPVKVLRRKKQGSHPQMMMVERADVVKGDIVKLEPGDEVPADGYILSAQNLMVDESVFTGEPYVHKGDETIQTTTTAYPWNFLLRSSIVIDGSCFYRVSATGVDTEEGKGIVIERAGNDVQTPLNKQLEQLGRWISVASFIIAGLIVVGRMLYLFMHMPEATGDVLYLLEYILESVMLAVTLIVVAVPEGLPMSVTMSLALSMRKMLQSNNLVRKLHACETMGATTVICTDKTGTLTQNKMKVMETLWGDEQQMDEVVGNMVINATAELDTREDGSITVVGNPTEGALLRWLQEQGISYTELREQAVVTEQVPFSTKTKMMSTIVQRAGKTIEYIKGAPEILLSQCENLAEGLTRDGVTDFLTSCQQRAMRTLGFAMRTDGGAVLFMGAVGIADPVREDVPEAVAICKNHAGVRVIIVTGDNVLTAKEVGRQIGLIDRESDVCIDGQDFAQMSDEQIMQVLPRLTILSRAKPEDKARLVTLLQRRGEVVAVTGDGTNDAPALSKAQVGLSMGDGTARAKEASDITILDNSFSSINKAIMWGRSLYLNIKRFIVFQMTINVCACLVVLAGAFMGMDSPLTVTQMLWVNLIMDTFAALALSSLPADERVMNDAPRNPNAHIIDRVMGKRILVVGVLFFLYLLGLWQLLWHGSIESVRELLSLDTLHHYIYGYTDMTHAKAHLSGYELGVFFTTFVLLQFWNLFNVKYFRTDRSLVRDIVDLFRDPKKVRQTYSMGYLVTLAVVLLGQVVIVNCFGPLFSVSALSWMDWVWLVLFTSLIMWIPEMIRCGMILWRRKKAH